MADKNPSIPQVGRGSNPESHPSDSPGELGCPTGSGGGSLPCVPVTAGVGHLAPAERNASSEDGGCASNPFGRSSKILRSPAGERSGENIGQKQGERQIERAMAQKEDQTPTLPTSRHLVDLELLQSRIDDCAETEEEQIKKILDLVNSMQSAANRQKNMSIDVKSGLVKLQDEVEFLAGIRKTRMETEQWSREIVARFVPPEISREKKAQEEGRRLSRREQRECRESQK